MNENKYECTVVEKKTWTQIIDLFWRKLYTNMLNEVDQPLQAMAIRQWRRRVDYLPKLAVWLQANARRWNCILVNALIAHICPYRTWQRDRFCIVEASGDPVFGLLDMFARRHTQYAVDIITTDRLTYCHRANNLSLPVGKFFAENLTYPICIPDSSMDSTSGA